MPLKAFVKKCSFFAEKMRFIDQVVNFGSYFEKSNKGFQIDLLFGRSDRTITMCEIKYCDQEILPSIIREMERKAALFPLPKGYALETGTYLKVWFIKSPERKWGLSPRYFDP